MTFSASFMEQDSKPKRSLSFDGGEGASAEPPPQPPTSKRPRGRPPGSKNKPKPPAVLVAREPEPSSAMRPHVLEIPPGHDIVDSLSSFSARRGLGLCVLAAAGSVANVTLRQPVAGSTVAFRGRFDILSVSAAFFPPGMAVGSPRGGGVTVSLAGPGGQVVGGAVVGPVVAAGTVTVVAAGFKNPAFHRLPVEDDDVSAPEEEEGYGPDDVAAPAPLMYSSGFAADAMWGPPPGPPRPPPF